jgi:tRNA A37 threonylcarbamoyladenosine synthetase subunit TsaC/SUA5/YrdC
MPVQPLADGGVTHAVEMLRAGYPVVVPPPSPLAYAVTGTRAAAVNTAKGRPASQPVGVSVADIDLIAPYLDFAAGVLPLARWLCESELVSLLAPVRPDAPGWLTPAISDGMVFFTAIPWLPELATIITTFGHLYMSSANLTGGRSATTAAAAGRAFGDDLVVLDGDAWRDQSRPHGSTTMVRMTRDGELVVARSGINNAAFGTDLDAYADDLSLRWRTARRGPGGSPQPR